jgi:DNA repair exonuclease SbcCD ATPase subunit
LKWIERLFGKKEPFSPEIGFDELAGWLESRSKQISGEVEKQVVPIYSDIEDALREIKKSASGLEGAQLEGRYHLKMVKVATTNRDNMVKQVRLLTDNITVPKATDIKTIITFHENAMQTLNVCLENMMKSYQYAKMVFLEDSKEVIADVNALGRLLNQLVEPLKDRKKLLDAAENALKTIQAIKEMRSAIELESISIKEKEEKAAALKKDIEEGQGALVRLRESEQWKQYQRSMDELAALLDNAKKTEAEINNIVLPLNKALNRLKQLSESGRYTLAPDIKEGLNSCLSDSKSCCPEFFIELEKIIVESDILKLEKLDKMLEQVRLAQSSFGLYKEQYQALMAEIEKKKDEIAKLGIVAEETSLGSKISELQEKLASAEKELEMAKNRLVSLERDIEDKKRDLQQMVSSIDSRVRVLF